LDETLRKEFVRTIESLLHLFGILAQVHFAGSLVRRRICQVFIKKIRIAAKMIDVR
jgi:hypothetical protein